MRSWSTATAAAAVPGSRKHHAVTVMRCEPRQHGCWVAFPPMVFRDRVDAGQQLADELEQIPLDRPVVLALPRGGVPVGAEVARRLSAPLDVILVRKLGVPGHRELAMGAIGEGGVRVINLGVVRAARVRDQELARIEAQERVELQRRASRYRDDWPCLSFPGRDAVIVDDGLATG